MTIAKDMAEKWLGLALSQADKVTGHTAENPAVGCAIISADGKLAGVGHTAKGGRPHAEVSALAMAGRRAVGGTAYVTLEPCCHYGKTGPCTKALIDAGIRQVVIAVTDPDERVNGAGIKVLEEADITVTIAPMARARRQMAGFLSRQTKNRPFISVKMATSLDGYITAKPGTQTWLTNEVSRRFVHDRRSRCDVMLTTAETILCDDPALNVRIAGYDYAQPPLAVLDRQGKLADVSRCFHIDREVIVYHGPDAILPELPSHVKGCAIAEDKGALCLPDIFLDLSKRGYSEVMVEAGAGLFNSLHQENLVDELVWLSAPHRLGGGLLAWQVADKMDFALPDNYITMKEFNLGHDRVVISHPCHPS